MTRVIETAQRTVANATQCRGGWTVTFLDGSCRLIKSTEIKGQAKFAPGKIIESCRTRCDGPDEKGFCTLRPQSRPRKDGNDIDFVPCEEQFVYVATPRNFGKAKPKFHACLAKRSFQIKTVRFIPSAQREWKIIFMDDSEKIVPESQILGYKKKLTQGNYFVPCDEECGKRDGTCPYCHGKRRGTKCVPGQFYFSHKFLHRHINDKIKQKQK